MFAQMPERVSENIGEFTGRSWILPRILHWLDNTHERLFLLVGKPGSGKSMISAWLGGLGPAPADSDKAQMLERVRGSVRAIYFCRSTDFNSPRDFAASVAEQLAGVVDGFADHVTASLSDHSQGLIRN